MEPYDSLYGSKCLISICWTELHGRRTLGPELVQEIEDIVRLIHDRLKEAFDRKKSYVDQRRKDIEFELMIERYSRTNLPDIEKNKFLVPRDMSVGQFIHILTRRLQLSPGKALFVFVNNTLPQTASLMGSVYNSFKNEDGFLYMCYSTEKIFC
ncbi:autophagy-related protein 8i-like [Hibiscus syriacus]|uniref:autophagy-related protein 8i-like n=1 Tax=Hibiscus syriacus TaxID=106335 RepID=UPI001923CC87|nr:autophagy-related protein 8i-like [Hibiscus syriacus]